MKHNPKTPKLPLKLVLNEITEQRASLRTGVGAERRTETEYVCERRKHKEETYLIKLQISNTFSV
jgi:hypothetical protein